LHYIFTCAPSEIDSVPILEEQENLGEQNCVPSLWIEGAAYYKSIGRYRKYADFEALCLSVFTREFYAQLNKNKKFIESDGDLYISADTGVVQMSLAYAPWYKPDKFELISESETEIKFTATGYYFEYLPENSDSDNAENKENALITGGEITSLSIEIILTRTETGWRFAQFATAGNPYIFAE